MSNEFNQHYWNERYRTGQTGWDIGYASPPLTDYIDGLTDKNLKILIPGGGNSYEADYLLQQGFTDVTVVDISSEIIQKLQKKYAATGLKAVCEDFFEHSGHYDLILEQTFFCAIDSALRPRYIRKMYELLTPAGILAGLLFDRLFVGGPPFGGTVDEYKHLFNTHFELERMALAHNSIPPRQGSEVFFVASPKEI